MTTLQSLASIGLLACLASGCAAPLTQGAPAVPQRPTVSSSTATIGNGELQLESGLAVDPGDAFAITETLRYGIEGRTEAILTWNPLVGNDSDAGRNWGTGDLSVGFRHRFLSERPSRPSVAVEFEAKIPTADETLGLGTGEVDLFGALIGTGRIGRTTITGYYRGGLIGDPIDAGNEQQHVFALAGDRPFGNVTALAELAAFDSDTDHVQLTLGGAAPLHASLVLDAAIVISEGEGESDTQLVIGLTRNFGRVFAR